MQVSPGNVLVIIYHYMNLHNFSISYYETQVSPGNDYEKPRLLNSLTAPNAL